LTQSQKHRRRSSESDRNHRPESSCELSDCNSQNRAVSLPPGASSPWADGSGCARAQKRGFGLGFGRHLNPAGLVRRLIRLIPNPPRMNWRNASSLLTRYSIRFFKRGLNPRHGVLRLQHRHASGHALSAAFGSSATATPVVGTQLLRDTQYGTADNTSSTSTRSLTALARSPPNSHPRPLTAAAEPGSALLEFAWRQKRLGREPRPNTYNGPHRTLAGIGALALGYLTHRLGWSSIVGYCLRILVGPHTPNSSPTGTWRSNWLKSA
jgi:hypothetical protein